MNAAEAARATIMAKGYGEAWRSLAIASAIGAISTAVTVFEMKSPSSAVSKWSRLAAWTQSTSSKSR
jgi:hypothetical protein